MDTMEHLKAGSFHRRPDNKLFFKPPLFRENEEERRNSRVSPSQPRPARERVPFVDSAGPHTLPRSPRRGRGGRPTQEVHPAPLAPARPPDTCPGPPAGDRQPHPHGLRCSRGCSAGPSPPLPGPRQARPSTSRASPPARSREASNAGPRGAAKNGDPSAPPPAAREPPARSALTPVLAVDPSAAHAGPLRPLGDSRGSALADRAGPRPCAPGSQDERRGPLPGPRTALFLQAGRRLPAGAPRPVPRPPPALGGEGAAARRGVGVGVPPPPPARTPRPTAGRAGAAAPRGSLRPARSPAHSPLRRVSGRAPPAEAVAASQGPKAAQLRVFSLHSPNTQEITERQVTARSQ